MLVFTVEQRRPTSEEFTTLQDFGVTNTFSQIHQVSASALQNMGLEQDVIILADSQTNTCMIADAPQYYSNAMHDSKCNPWILGLPNGHQSDNRSK